MPFFERDGVRIHWRLDGHPDRPALVLVNSLGSTPFEELFILYRRAAEKLGEAALTIVNPLIGPYVTSMEMGGASISLCFLDDDIEALLAAPANCPFWKVG